MGARTLYTNKQSIVIGNKSCDGVGSRWAIGYRERPRPEYIVSANAQRNCHRRAIRARFDIIEDVIDHEHWLVDRSNLTFPELLRERVTIKTIKTVIFTDHQNIGAGHHNRRGQTLSRQTGGN